MENQIPERVDAADRPLGIDRARWGRPVAVGLTVTFTVIGLVILWFGMIGAGQHIVGLDIGHYLDGTRRWLDSGSPYLPNEVAGPFEIDPLTFLHPPLALYLFLPFLVLPTILWWVIPIGIVAWCVVSWRPAAWTWPVMAALLALTRFHIPLVVGNTDLWVWAAIALGLRFSWPSLLVAIKPSLIPFIVIGIRHRAWWIAAVVVGIAALPLGALWLDWLAVLRHAPKDLSYSLPNVPWLLIPVIAWATRTRELEPPTFEGLRARLRRVGRA
jgi:hypothetical protein